MAILATATDKHLYATSGSYGSTTSPFSMSAWINANWSTATTISMVGLYNGSATVTPTVGLQIGVVGGTGAFSCWRYGGTQMVATPANAMVPYNNIWTHVVYTYNGTNHIIYVNGSQVASTTTAQIAGAFTQLWLNGYPPSSANETAAYSFNNVSLYNRPLVPNEVMTIYTSAGIRHGIIDGLVAQYICNDDIQGAAVIGVLDLTGSGNPLVVYGAGTNFTYSYVGDYPTSNLRTPI